MILIAASLFAQSCSKNEILTNNQSKTEPSASYSSGEEYVPSITSCLVGVSTSNGRIKFGSVDNFKNTMGCMALKTEEMDSLFLADYGHLNDSLLNDVMDSIGYSEDLVYKAFEDYFSFTSLRMLLEDEMNSWLGDWPLDTNSIPNHIIGDAEFQTVLNTNAEFYLVDTLYYILSDGSYYRILNGSELILDSIKEATVSNDNRFVEFNAAFKLGNSCKATKSTPNHWSHSSNDNGKYGMAYKCGFYNIWPKTTVWSDTESYKRQSGDYKKYKTNIEASVLGTPHSKDQDGDCLNPLSQYFGGASKNKTNYRYTITWWDTPLRWETGGHTGGHYCDKVGVRATIVQW